jgi:hypothetical protein
MSTPEIEKRALQKEWLHSREEDTGAQIVFRPSDYDFPLTRRPREIFELRSDGTLIKGTPSAADSVESKGGRWKLEGGDKLVFYSSPGGEPVETWKIASVDNDRLVLEKP